MCYFQLWFFFFLNCLSNSWRLSRDLPPLTPPRRIRLPACEDGPLAAAPSRSSQSARWFLHNALVCTRIHTHAQTHVKRTCGAEDLGGLSNLPSLPAIAAVRSLLDSGGQFDEMDDDNVTFYQYSTALSLQSKGKRAADRHRHHEKVHVR